MSNVVKIKLKDKQKVKLVNLPNSSKLKIWEEFFVKILTGFGKNITSPKNALNDREIESFENALTKISFLVSNSIENNKKAEEELKKIILQINEDSENIIDDLKNQLSEEKEISKKTKEEKNLITENFMELKEKEQIFLELKKNLEKSNELLEKENADLKMINCDEISEIENMRKE